MRMAVLCLVLLVPQSLVAADRRPDNEFLNLLELVHLRGREPAGAPEADPATKARIEAALRRGSPWTRDIMEELMDTTLFAELAGDDKLLDAAEVRRALEQQTPATRRALFPGLQAHCQFLSTGFDLIPESRYEAIRQLGDWIAENYQTSQPLPLIFVCTGNSRRSLLGSALGNATAAYCGLPEIRCSSGGTRPSAFNPRTIATLQDIGFEIAATGEEGPRGSEPANPIYEIRWGTEAAAFPQRVIEFSKSYDHAHNPRSGFAAVMVCSDADISCPTVAGAGARIAMRFLDPKLYDNTELESQKYAERRDDMGRILLAAMVRARLRLVAQGKLK